MTKTGNAGSYRPTREDDRHVVLPGFRRWLVTLACCYSLFVIYGSLVPLDFSPLPLVEAIERFRNIRYLNLGIASRADWVANILLYIPLSFFVYGALSQGGTGSVRRIALALLAFLFGAALGVAIEFVQIFFPPRTVSLNDVLAQTIGSLIGIAAWLRLRSGIEGVWTTWHRQDRKDRMISSAVGLYLAAVFAYGLLPLDLTISIAEIHDKWAAGRFIINPFRMDDTGWVENVYALGTDALLWMPLTWFALCRRQLGPASAVILTTGVAACLEIAQTVVYTRIVDTRDVLMAFLGAATLAFFLGKRGAASQTYPRAFAGRDLSNMAMLLVWSVFVLAVFWYPYKFTDDVGQIARRLNQVSVVPFRAYYFGTEFRAITEVLHKVAMFVPYGVLVAIVTPRSTGAMLCAAAIAGIVEAGQVLIPGKVVDPADILLALVGAVLAHRATRAIVNRRSEPTPPEHTRAATVRSMRTVGPPSLLMYGAFLCMCAVASVLVTDISALPYNVREVVATGAPALSGIGLGLVAITLVVATTTSAVWLSTPRGPSGLVLVPLALVAVGVIVWGLLHMSVPREAIYDLVGSPVLHWPWVLETMLRTATLVAFAVFAASVGGAMGVDRAYAVPARYPVIFRNFLLAIVLLPFFHHVIVTAAATDNLTELMEGGGSYFTTIALGAWIALLSLVAYASCAMAHYSIARVFVAALASLLTAPFGYLLLSIALEDRVFKYGAEFSALQFLLSPTREMLVAGPSLMLRYSVLHVGSIVVLAVLCTPILRWLLRIQGPFVGQFADSEGSGIRETITTHDRLLNRSTVLRAERVRPEAYHFDNNVGAATTMSVRLREPDCRRLKHLAGVLECSIEDVISRILDFLMTDERGVDWIERERGRLRHPQSIAGLHDYQLTLADGHACYLEQLGERYGISVSRIVRAAIKDFAPQITAGGAFRDD